MNCSVVLGKFQDTSQKIKTEDMKLEELPQFDDALIKKEIKMEPMEKELIELHHSVDIKEEPLTDEPSIINTGRTPRHKGRFKRHVRTRTREKSYGCNICEFKCNYKGNLKSHLTTHTGEKPYKCHICDFKSAGKYSMKNHLAIHTRDEKPFECHLCSFKCFRKISFTLHLKNHSVGKLLECEICNNKFHGPASLENHMLTTHIGEDWFEYYLCGYKQCKWSRFTQRYFSGEDPYECNVCDFKSYHKSCFKLHQEIHSSDKLFQCYICDHQCNRKATLKLHILNHTSTQRKNRHL